jgi:hypothetical protein
VGGETTSSNRNIISNNYSHPVFDQATYHLTTTMVPRTTIDRLPHEICVATAINSLQVCNYYYCFLSTHPWVAIPVDSTLVSSPAMRRWICGYLLVVSNSPPKIYI